MTPQRRTALVSIVAACALIALKVVTGIATHSLGLLSEAAHSGVDLVAAILTFYAVGVAGRPADRSHAYGHGKAEHLAALGEAGILVAAALVIAWRAVWRFNGVTPTSPEATWVAPVALGLAGRGRGSRPVRGRARPAGRGAADASQRRRADGPRSVGGPSSGAPGDRRPRPAGSAAAPAHAPGGWAQLRRRRDRRLARRRGGSGARSRRRGGECRPDRAAGERRRRPRRAADGRCRAAGAGARRGATGPERARDPQPERALDRRPHRGLAPPEAPRRPPAPGGPRGRDGGRARDRRLRARGRLRPDASRAARRGGSRDERGARGRRARPRGREPDRPRHDRRLAARAAVPGHRRRARRVPDARPRSVDRARRCTCARQRGRGADPPRAPRGLRRNRPHGTLKLCMFTPNSRELRGWLGKIEGDRV